MLNVLYPKPFSKGDGHCRLKAMNTKSKIEYLYLIETLFDEAYTEEEKLSSIGMLIRDLERMKKELGE